MWALLTTVSRRYFGRHRFQVALVILGVALGVAVWVGIETARASLTAGMRDTVDKVAGKAQIEISAGETGVPEATLDLVRDQPEVLAASPVIEATVHATEFQDTSLLLLGIDFLGDKELRNWTFDDADVLDDPLVFLAQPDSLCVTREFATRHGLKRGASLVLRTALGDKKFTIRGLIEPTGPGRAYGGSVIVMDVYSAQYQLGRGARFDRIDVRLVETVPLDDGRARLSVALGSGFDVGTPGGRSVQLTQLLDTFAATLQLGSWQAMLVAVFLIYNVFAVAAARRRHDLGVLRALGATRRQIARLFLCEGLILGLAGTAIGIVLGRLLASGMVSVMRLVIEAGYGFSGAPPQIRLAPGVLVSAIVLGLGGALAGAWWPARHASRMSPLEALSRGRVLTGTATEARPRVLIGLGLLIVSAIAALAGNSVPPLLLALIGIHGAAVLLGPSLVSFSTRCLRPLSRRGHTELQLATESLHAAPRRTNAAVLALLISVSFVVSMAGFIASFAKAYTTFAANVITGDFYLTASPQFISKPLRLPLELYEPVAAVEGVKWVEEFRSFRFDYQGRRPMAVSLPFAKTYQRVHVDVDAGDEASGKARIIRGEAIGVSTNFSRIFNVGVGDNLTIPTPTGPLTLPVALVVLDFTSDQGVVWFDRRLLLERFGDTSCDYFVVMRQPGVDLETLRPRLVEALRGKAGQMFIFSGAEFRAEVQKLFDQFFSFTYVQLLMALVVAVLGITNTLLISVMERTSEIGVLRALGATRRQVSRLVILEALLLATIGGTIGFAFGLLEMRVVAVKLSSIFTGWTVPPVFPWGFTLVFVPLLFLASVIAALYPARRAASLAPAEALAAE